MKDIVFHIPRGLREYTIIQQAIVGRLVVLSHKGNNEVYYSTNDAYRDGFTKQFNNAFNSLQKKSVIASDKSFGGCRRIRLNRQVLQMDSCIYINVPVSVMKSDKLNFAEKIMFGRIYTQTKQGTERIKLTTEMLVNELGLSDKSVKTYLKTLKDLELISTDVEYNGYIRERYICVNVDKIADMERVNSTLPIFSNLPDQSSVNYPTNFKEFTLSSSKLQEHILQEPILQECKSSQEIISKDSEYPLSSIECESYFVEYIQKYAHTNGALQMINVPFEASQFFEYWSTRDWKDSKGKKVKSLKGRVATWIGRNIEKYERQYKRSNPLANLKTSEQLCAMYGSIPNPLGVRDESVKVLGFSKDEQDSQQVINDDLPF